MSRLHRFYVVLAAVHLLIVAMGALGIDLRGAVIPPARVFCLYGALTGANNRYGFFAPEVQTPTRASFTMTDAQGNSWHDTLAQGTTSEANLRLGTIAFLLPALSPEDQDKLMRSFVATMFGRYPEATTVRLHFEMYGVRDGENLEEFPTMEHYREGQRPEWITLMTTPPYRRSQFTQF